MEEWVAVPGFEGFYEASTEGRVRSLDRVDSGGRQIRGRVLKPGRLQSGRLQVVLCRGGVKYQMKVHQVVALTFHGPCPDGEEVRHYPDRDTTNNRPGNLLYGTKRRNFLDSVEHGTHKELRKTQCPRGHDLVAPNIRKRVGKAKAWRECLACCLAGNRCHIRSSPEFKPLADALYRQIMEGATKH